MAQPSSNAEKRQAEERKRARRIAQRERDDAAQEEATSLTGDIRRVFGGLNVFGVRR